MGVGGAHRGPLVLPNIPDGGWDAPGHPLAALGPGRLSGCQARCGGRRALPSLALALALGAGPQTWAAHRLLEALAADRVRLCRAAEAELPDAGLGDGPPVRAPLDPTGTPALPPDVRARRAQARAAPAAGDSGPTGALALGRGARATTDQPPGLGACRRGHPATGGPSARGAGDAGGRCRGDPGRMPFTPGAKALLGLQALQNRTAVTLTTAVRCRIPDIPARARAAWTGAAITPGPARSPPGGPSTVGRRRRRRFPAPALVGWPRSGPS